MLRSVALGSVGRRFVFGRSAFGTFHPVGSAFGSAVRGRTQQFATIQTRVQKFTVEGVITRTRAAPPVAQRSAAAPRLPAQTARRMMSGDTKGVVTRSSGGASGGASGGSGSKKSGIGDRVADIFAMGKSGMIIAGVCTGVCGFAYTAYSTSLYTSGFSAKDGMTIGIYVGGIASTLVALGGGLFLRRLFSIHPESVYSDVLSRVTANPQVMARLGKNHQPGKFKAYAYKGGLNVDTTAGVVPKVTFSKYGLQLMFQLTGYDQSAMISAEAKQSLSSGYDITNLAIDFNDGKRTLMVGDDQDVAFKGVVRLR